MKCYPLFTVTLLMISACNGPSKVELEQQTQSISHESFYLSLGGEEQYIEVLGTSSSNPYLLLVHGGPGWPQTPQFRYFNKEIATRYNVIIWEQRGAGQSFAKNPNPSNLTLNQIIQDGLDLTDTIRLRYNQDKIILAGYSWGSLVGVQMAAQNPTAYSAYFGIAQFINKGAGMSITRNWLKEQALEKNDLTALAKIDSLEHIEHYESEHDRFFQQYLLVNEYGGAVYNKNAEIEVAKAEKAFDDYKEYDWYGVWNASSKVLQQYLYRADVRTIQELPIPVVLFQGRHDWNVPSVLAQSWLNELKAPLKKIYWFENSGHGPLEEEPQAFNQAVIEAFEFILPVNK